MTELKTNLRTNTCGELTKKEKNKEVVLCGWVQSRRDHGGVIFVDLRDRYGITQVVFDPSNHKEMHKLAERLGREYVLQIKGKVRLRKKGMENKKIKTGEIEVLVSKLDILNEALVPPIEIDDRKVANDDLRLEHRYLDLRRPQMQRQLRIRHEAAQATREYFSKQGFMEIETPILIRSTPEGARDYIVPSRVNPGKFYSLPQSPQLYKQILMVSGCDRYFQMARCLRDEDLRSDRQPEFTQIDVEMSYVDEEDVFKTVEGCMKYMFKKVIGKELKTPFTKLTYEEAMNKYGSEKPDIRFKMGLKDISDIAAESDFGVFRDVVKHEGVVKGINAKRCGKFSRKELDELTHLAGVYGAKGLVYVKMSEGKLESSVMKYINKKLEKEIIKRMNAKNGDLLLFIADKFEKACLALGQLRLDLGRKLKLIDENEFSFCWIREFPLFEWDEDSERWAPMHHIFSMPMEETIKYLEKDPGKVKGKLYDLALNGTEIWGGSIRIHRKDIQERVLKVIGLDYKDAERRFGFLLNSFKYGAPPHGGIAAGFDRIVALMCGTNDIREVIAFPKNKSAENPMDGCPSEVDEEQLKELHLKLDIVKKKRKK